MSPLLPYEMVWSDSTINAWETNELSLITKNAKSSVFLYRPNTTESKKMNEFLDLSTVF